MKIFAINDCVWWIGKTLEECVSDYEAEYGDDIEEARELEDGELDSLKFVDIDEDERRGESRSFREQLAIEIAEGGHFPRMFATSEW